MEEEKGTLLPTAADKQNGFVVSKVGLVGFVFLFVAVIGVLAFEIIESSASSPTTLSEDDSSSSICWSEKIRILLGLLR